jgi:8-oxo-dGTP diphosphatase
MNTMPDQPLIAIDVVPVCFTAADGLQIGTAERAYDPYAGLQALPGVLLNSGEQLADAALRALEAKAGVVERDVRHLMQIGAFDGPLRDPRLSAISIAHLAVVAPGAGGNTEWQTSELRSRDLPFDHDDIVAEALNSMRARLWNDKTMTRALTGDVFDTVTARKLIVALTGLERQPDSAASTGGRPPVRWRWAF